MEQEFFHLKSDSVTKEDNVIQYPYSPTSMIVNCGINSIKKEVFEDSPLSGG